MKTLLNKSAAPNVGGRRLFSKLQIIVLLVLGCKEQPTFHSQFFSSVEVVGRRGAGAGELNKPRSVAVDREDNLYVVDMTGRGEEISAKGEILSFWRKAPTGKGKTQRTVR